MADSAKTVLTVVETPAAPAAPATPPSIIGAGDPPAEPAKPAPADWPSDWRDKMAGTIKPGDAKFRERLERFASPVEIARGWAAAEQKISETRPVPKLPEGATPEQIAAYRKDNGIPEKPENYSIEIPGGAKFDESDMPLVQKFLADAHAKNWTQQQVTENLLAWKGLQQTSAQRLVDLDNEAHQRGEDALRAAWGNDYRRNVNAVGNLLAGMPEELHESFIGGRLADGTRIGDNPAMIQWLASIAIQYPSLTPAGEAPGATDRLAEIRKFRQADPDKYDQDKAMQAEERKLLEMQLRAKPRAA